MTSYLDCIHRVQTEYWDGRAESSCIWYEISVAVEHLWIKTHKTNLYLVEYLALKGKKFSHTKKNITHRENSSLLVAKKYTYDAE